MHFSSFAVKHVGKGEFYGWSIDGNERFLLGNFVVTHNSRLQGGDDSASERYIFTQLAQLTRTLFPEADDAVLTYLDDDGTTVEPEYYVPIIPFALINGISGIGTGFSCSIPSYDPLTIVQYLRNRLNGQQANNEAIEFVPYYEGFKGSVRKIADQKFLVKGQYSKASSTSDIIRITELPVGSWTMPYITFLEGLMDGSAVDKQGKKIPASIKDFTSVSTEVSVDITVTLPKGQVAALEATIDANGINGLEKLLKLATTVSSTNMHMFNAERKLRKYAKVEDIITEFYDVRMSTYEKRKSYLIEDLERKLIKLSNRAKFILANLDGSVDLRKKSAVEVQTIMVSKGFAQIDGDFKYLIKMPMDSVTQENVASILADKDAAEQELAKLRATSLEKMWLSELDVFDKEYASYKTKRQQIQSGIALSGKDGAIKKMGKKIVITK
jgi:DNA topoisomerase-2